MTTISLFVPQARVLGSRQFTRVANEAMKLAPPVGNGVYSVLRLPTETIGIATVTFEGINANSEIRVYLPDGTEAAGVENCDADHVLTWGAYAPGNANNTVTIRIVHPDYEIQEFTYTVRVGDQSLPIQQLPDRWYSNPA